MAYDISELLARPVTASERRQAKVLEDELADMRLAAIGLAMHRQLMDPHGLQDLLETLMARGWGAAAITRRLQLYMLTGQSPVER